MLRAARMCWRGASSCRLSKLSLKLLPPYGHFTLGSKCRITCPIRRSRFLRVHVRSHLLYVPIKLSWLYYYSTTLPSITAEPFLRHRQQIHLAKHKHTGQTIPITTGLTRTTYRIKAILEAVTARYIRIVFLQACKALALEQLIIHTRAGALRKLAMVVLEVQFPACKERQNGSIRDREVFTHCELCPWREQVLNLRYGPQ